MTRHEHYNTDGPSFLEPLGPKFAEHTPLRARGHRGRRGKGQAPVSARRGACPLSARTAPAASARDRSPRNSSTGRASCRPPRPTPRWGRDGRTAGSPPCVARPKRALLEDRGRVGVSTIDQPNERGVTRPPARFIGASSPRAWLSHRGTARAPYRPRARGRDLGLGPPGGGLAAGDRGPRRARNGSPGARLGRRGPLRGRGGLVPRPARARGGGPRSAATRAVRSRASTRAPRGSRGGA
jgi:hypothetical protein